MTFLGGRRMKNKDSTKSNPSELKDESTPDEPTTWQFVRRCYRASCGCGYVAAIVAPYPLSAWEIGEAKTVAVGVFLLPLLVFNPHITLYFLSCVAISSLWVVPIALCTRLDKEARLLGICTLSALVSIGLFIYLSVSYPSRHSSESIRATCGVNLSSTGLALLMYSHDDDRSLYPELSNVPGTLAVRDDKTYQGIYPDYLDRLDYLQCPAKTRWQELFKPLPPTSIADDRCYFYLGFQISDQETLEHFAAAYRAVVSQGGTFDGNLVMDGARGTPVTIQRLGDRSESPLESVSSIQSVGEAAAKTPVLIERYPNGHTLDGGNVLYTNGHVAWIPWGERWPMTEEAMAILLALDGLEGS